MRLEHVLIFWQRSSWLCAGSVGIGIWNHSVNPSATPLVMGILERSGLVQHQCLKSQLSGLERLYGAAAFGQCTCRR